VSTLLWKGGVLGGENHAGKIFFSPDITRYIPIAITRWFNQLVLKINEDFIYRSGVMRGTGRPLPLGRG
jgi:hypothetical protein